MEQGMAVTEEWQRLKSEVVAKYSVFDIQRHVMRSPRTGEAHEFHVVDVPASVKVIPFTVDGRVVLVEQFRQGVQRVSLELPAGIIDEGEDAIEAAVRELEEETGYRAATAQRLTDFDPDPAIQSNCITIVVARGCTADGERDQDDGEDVSVRVVSEDDVAALIRDGSIRHAASITAWYLYQQLAGGSGGAP
jgi:ADP-ribose pyrophosphatase